MKRLDIDSIILASILFSVRTQIKAIMNEKGQNNHEKGKMWESFISLLNHTCNKKGNDEEMKKWIDFISTSVDDLDSSVVLTIIT